MEKITIDSDAFKTLVKKIDRIYTYVVQQEAVNAQTETTPGEAWIDDQEAQDMLGVSKRTMQRLRSKGEITYSIRWHKVFYTLPEIMRVAKGRIIQGKLRQEKVSKGTTEGQKQINS